MTSFGKFRGCFRIVSSRAFERRIVRLSAAIRSRVMTWGRLTPPPPPPPASRGWRSTPANAGLRSFIEEQEAELAAHCRTLDGLFYGLKRRYLMSLAYQHSQLNNIPNPFSKDKKSAGKELGARLLYQARSSIPHTGDR